MKNTKTHSVVMLPTKKASDIYLKEGILLYPEYGKREGVDEAENQHIHVLSDDDINFGDYFYSPAYRSIRQSAMNKYDGENCKKIIASTDKEITPNSWIPEPFVLAYIKAYREGRMITEVDLEVRTKSSRLATGEEALGDEYKECAPITRPDRSVIFHQSKMFSREEVEDLIYSAMKSRNYTPLSEYREWLSENL